MVRKLFFVALAGLVLSVALSPVVPVAPVLLAQTTTTQTTLSAAITATQQTFTLASGTGVSAGRFLYIDDELMSVQSISSATVTVTRGVGGTQAAHVSGAYVIAGAGGSSGPFHRSPRDKSGACTATAEPTTIQVNLETGSVLQCLNGFYTRMRSRGFANNGENSSVTYTGAGAIALHSGMHLVNGTTLAMTIAAPTKVQDGMVLSVCAANASAHTLTFTGGFGGGGTGEDVATFSGAAGDCITLRAANLLWWIVGSHQVTVA